MNLLNILKEITITPYRATLQRLSDYNLSDYFILELSEDMKLGWTGEGLNLLSDFMISPSRVQLVREFLAKKGIPYLFDGQEFSIPNYKKYFKIEKDLNEITIKPPTPKFIILKKFKGGETFLDVDWSGVEKYCITLIPNIDENYIADIVMGWDQQNQDFQAYPEKIDEYNLSLYNYVNERLKSYKSKYLQEITIKSPHPLDKIPLLKPGTQIYSEFKISGRTYKISGEVRYISGPDTNDNHYFIIIHKNNRNLASPSVLSVDIPADKTEYKFHQQRAAKGEFVGKQPFGTLFLDNMTIISQPEEINEIEIDPNLIPKIKELIEDLKSKHNRFNGLIHNISNLLMSLYYNNKLGKGGIDGLSKSSQLELYKELLKLKKVYEKNPESNAAYLDEIEIKQGGPGFIIPAKIKSADLFFGDVNKAIFKIDYDKILEWCKATNRNYNLAAIKEIVRQWKENQLKGQKMLPKDISKYDSWLYTFLSTVLQTQTKRKIDEIDEIDEIEIKPQLPLKIGEFYSINFYKARRNMPEKLDQWTPPRYKYAGTKKATSGNIYHIFDIPSSYISGETAIPITTKNWFKTKEQYIKDHER